jgi:hypothetical protein
LSYLLIGGPAHGQQRDVPIGESEITVLAPSPGNPVPTPFKYVLREIVAETRPGMNFKRVILVEKNLRVEIATQALAQLLLQNFTEELVRQFMEGGELVGNGTEQHRPSETETGTESRLLRA